MSKRPPKKHKAGPHNPKPQKQQGIRHKDKAGAPPPKRTFRVNLFGFHAVAAAWQNPARNFEALYLTDQAAEGFEETLRGAQSLRRPEPQIIDKRDLERALPPGTVHQGLAALAAPLAETGVQDLIIRAQNSEPSLLLILDQVTDPHNVGAILRSACAFGADGIIMQRKHAPELSGVLAKTACGALEHIPVAFETNLSRTIETLQEAGYFVAGLDERGEDIASYKPSQKTALVLGAEGPGIRHLVKEHCDILLRLPMYGAMPSINVSNAAAVALYALAGCRSHTS